MATLSRSMTSQKGSIIEFLDIEIWIDINGNKMDQVMKLVEAVDHGIVVRSLEGRDRPRGNKGTAL